MPSETKEWTPLTPKENPMARSFHQTVCLDYNLGYMVLIGGRSNRDKHFAEIHLYNRGLMSHRRIVGLWVMSYVGFVEGTWVIGVCRRCMNHRDVLCITWSCDLVKWKWVISMVKGKITLSLFSSCYIIEVDESVDEPLVLKWIMNM